MKPYQYARHCPCESAVHGDCPQHGHVFDRSGFLRFLNFRHAFIQEHSGSFKHVPSAKRSQPPHTPLFHSSLFFFFFFFMTFSFKGVEVV